MTHEDGINLNITAEEQLTALDELMRLAAAMAGGLR